MNYLKSFLIGANILVVAMFYISVQLNKKKNYTFDQYAFIAPMYFGVMNIISTIIAKKYKIGLRQRVFYTSLISPFLVLTFVNLTGSYPFTTMKDWIIYFTRIFTLHFIAWNVIIYNIEKNINK